MSEAKEKAKKLAHKGLEGLADIGREVQNANRDYIDEVYGRGYDEGRERGKEDMSYELLKVMHKNGYNDDKIIALLGKANSPFDANTIQDFLDRIKRRERQKQQNNKKK